MDSLHAIGFYVSAALAGVGGLGVAFLRRHERPRPALGLFGPGGAGAPSALSAGFAAVIAILCYAGCALLIARPDYRTVEQAVGTVWRQVGAVAAAVLFAALTYAAYRGDFVHANFYGGVFGSNSLARLMFAHDALATEAIAGFVLVALVGGAFAWRRERPRDHPEGRQ